MIDRAVGKFKNSLGPRIDALEVARYALDRNDAAAAEAVQKLVQGLRVSIPSCEFTAIFDAVLAVEQATAEELSMKLGVLLDVLRKEMAAPMQTLFPVLLAGTDPEFMEPLATELETYGYEVLSAASSALARRLLGERRVQFVVIQGDIRVAGENSLVQALRLSPANASAHIVVVQDTDGPPPPGRRRAFGQRYALTVMPI